MILLAVLLGLGMAGFLIWWLLIETEGVYLGRRVVIALYDLAAHRYDRIKQFDAYADHALVSQAILAAIAPKTDPLILDVATGSGRVPLLMASNADFNGHVVGIDASGRMLSVAREKVAAQGFDSFVTLLRQDASQLPFPAEHFDVVTCLEALEFMPDQAAVLAEMARVLKPGGILLTTIRIDTRWMPDRIWNEPKMRAALEALGLCDIHFAIWQEDYSQVWARKQPPLGPPDRSGGSTQSETACLKCLTSEDTENLRGHRASLPWQFPTRFAWQASHRLAPTPLLCTLRNAKKVMRICARCRNVGATYQVARRIEIGFTRAT